MASRPALLGVQVAAVAVVTALASVSLAAAGAVGAGPPSTGAIDAGPVASGSAAESTGSLHGNHVVVGPQVSTDGTVVAEEAATLASGWLVLRRDDSGQPGEPVGHTYLNGSALRTDVSVAVDEGVWADWSGTRTLWAVVHFDDGDGEFDTATDPPAADRYPAAAQQFALERGESPVHLLARQPDPLALTEGSITVRHVALAHDGYVVAHPIDGDRVVGSHPLSAGRHDDVTLDLDADFVADQDDRFRVRLVAYRDDGDGEFDADDSPVRVGGDPVDTDVVVRLVGDNATTTEPLVITPTPSETPADPSTGADTASTATTAPSSETVTDTDASGPGFGVGAVLVTLVLVAVHRRK